MGDPARVRVDGPLEQHADGFRGELADRGYSPNTAACHLRLMGHLSRWLAGQGMDCSALTPEVVQAYFARRRAAGYATYRTGRALQPLLGYLRDHGVVAVAAPAEVTAAGLLLARFAGYLAGERGLAESTIRNYLNEVQPFLQAWEPGGLRRLGASDVTTFVVATSSPAASPGPRCSSPPTGNPQTTKITEPSRPPPTCDEDRAPASWSSGSVRARRRRSRSSLTSPWRILLTTK
jgi:hypothetical protein